MGWRNGGFGVGAIKLPSPLVRINPRRIASCGRRQARAARTAPRGSYELETPVAGAWSACDTLAICSGIQRASRPPGPRLADHTPRQGTDRGGPRRGRGARRIRHWVPPSGSLTASAQLLVRKGLTARGGSASALPGQTWSGRSGHVQTEAPNSTSRPGTLAPSPPNSELGASPAASGNAHEAVQHNFPGELMQLPQHRRHESLDVAADPKDSIGLAGRRSPRARRTSLSTHITVVKNVSAPSSRRQASPSTATAARKTPAHAASRTTLSERFVAPTGQWHRSTARFSQMPRAARRAIRSASCAHRSAIVTIAIRPPSTNGQHAVKRLMRDLHIDA